MSTKTRQVKVGNVLIGGGAPVSVQSMTNTDTADVEATLSQIRALTVAGADIVRVSVYNEACAEAVRALVDGSPVPLVADIHFDYKLAIKAVENGIHKLRINPGNIGGEKNVCILADCVKAHHIPVRIGVNSGSVEKGLLEKYGLCAKTLCESALGHAKLLENCGFEDICISVKASDPAMTVAATRLLSTLCDYPLHLGVTEAGTKERGMLKSAAGIGSLLLDGIGDTIRVSLTDAPEEVVRTGTELLRALGLRSGVRFVSCPTCGRTEYDLIGTAKAVEERLRDKPWDITVAVMGCVVNGPGEASHADYGIAGGKSEGVIFKHGEPVARVASDKLADALVELIESENG